jgi:hypothetical protein
MTQVRAARSDVAASMGPGTTSWSSRATSWVITERLSADLAPHPHGGQTGQSQTGRSIRTNVRCTGGGGQGASGCQLRLPALEGRRSGSWVDGSHGTRICRLERAEPRSSR